MNQEQHRSSRSTAVAPGSGRAPRRLLVPGAVLLALLTGAVLGQGRPLLAPAVLATDPRDDATAAVARRFYDAVDTALRTGDVGALADIVDPDFADHAGDADTPGTRETLLRSVRALAATRPAPRLTPLDLVATGDRAVARLRLDGAARTAFLGIPVALGTAWSAIEVLRVAGGRVAERWGTPGGTTLLEPLVDAPVDVHALGPRSVTLTRLTLATHATYEAPPTALSAVLLEAGALASPVAPNAPGPATVWRAGPTTSAAAPETVAAGQRAVLGPGDLLVPAKDAVYTLDNDGGGAATVLLLTVVDPAIGSEPAATDAALPDGVTAVVLAGGVEVTPRFGAARLLIGRAALAAGAELEPHTASNAELVTVESGILRLATADAGIAVRRAADGTSAQTDRAVLSVGDGALVPPGATVELRAEGPESAVVVVVRLAADGPGEGEADFQEAPD